MKLQTQIKIEPALKQFGYQDTLLLIGSCFAENIGTKLAYHKFQSATNPFGILFNPVVIEQLIQDAVLNKTYTEQDVFEHNGIWKSFLAHSALNATSRLEAVINLQEAQQELRTTIIEASHIYITLGTAWVYRHLEKDCIVANCHKIPQKEFKKELLSVQEVNSCLEKICNHITGLNPTAHIVFTVSPVRHVKDGFIENMRSKSHLISAIHLLVDGQKAHYFPSYELMMDELRDYRFYASDMLHPSEQAIDYIWEKFVEGYAFAKAKETIKKVASIKNRLDHKAFNPESTAHQQFLKVLKQDIEQVQIHHKHIVF